MRIFGNWNTEAVEQKRSPGQTDFGTHKKGRIGYKNSGVERRNQKSIRKIFA
jgi:hypothetical protein